MITYDKITFRLSIRLEDAGLNRNPASNERIMTNSRLAKMNKATFSTFAQNTPSLETGLVSVIFMVLDENSPLNISMTTKVAKRGRMVLEKSDRTTKGNSVLPTTLNPKPLLIAVTAI